MSPRKPNRPFSSAHMNAWRMHQQWLDRPFKGRNLLDLVRSVGWIYSPGCSTPYLSIWARTQNFRPAKLDRLVFDQKKLVQLDTLRGCTMLVPREDAPIALQVRSRTFTELCKQARSLMPINESELERLKNSIVRALEKGSSTHDKLLKAVPSGLVREFPPSLRRIGITGSLWLAIHLLKEEGRIVKIQSARRLDQTEYEFALLSDLLPEIDAFRLKPELANIELAKVYFRSEAPARVKDFAWWAGLNVTDAIRAVDELEPRLARIKIAKSQDEFLISEEEIDEFANFVPTPSVNLLPFRDVYLKGQREVVNRFVHRKHSDKPFSRWKGKLINDPLATIVLNGEVVGLWEWDPVQNHQLNLELFGESVTKKDQELIRRRATELGKFIREHLRDVRLQGVDYGRHQMTRIRELKAYWGRGPRVDVGTV